MLVRNVSLMVIAAMIAIGTGIWYSNQRFQERLGKKTDTLNFWLLDQGGELIKFPNREKHKTLIYYMPDNVSFETQKNFMKIIENKERFAEFGVRVLPVSRNLRDNLINLKKKSGFWDSIIHDPSGVVLQFFRQFRSEWKNDHWVSAMFDEDGKLLWAEINDSPVISTWWLRKTASTNP